MVTFETFKDRETVLKLAKTLSKKAKINVSEDLSKRTREARYLLMADIVENAICLENINSTFHYLTIITGKNCVGLCGK